MKTNIGGLVNVWTKTHSGHRAEYLAFAIDNLHGTAVPMWRLLVGKNPAFFLMIEDSFFLYALVCLLRSMVGRRTVGLLFRLKPAVEGKGLRLLIKRNVLRCLVKLHSVHTLSIVPTSLVSGSDAYVDSWVYDFQLWDISREEMNLFDRLASRQLGGEEDAHSLVKEIQSSAESRRIFSAIGVQNEAKGSDLFLDIYANSLDIQREWCFVSGGKVHFSLKEKSELFDHAGGFLVDRFVSKEELIALYAVSDVVWCRYAEKYDQASGILGRAIQFGIPVVVRYGSLSHRFCEMLGADYVADGSTGDIHALLGTAGQKDLKRGRALADSFRSSSIQRLSAALQIEIEI